MEPRRIVLAVVLMAAVLLVTPYLFPTPTPVPGARKATADSAQTVSDSSAPSVSGAVAGDAMGAPAVPAEPAVVLPVDTAVVNTAVADYRTTSKGAALIGASLTQFQALSNGGRTRSGTVELALPNERMLGYRLVVPGDTIDLTTQTFRSTQSADGNSTVITYDADLAGRLVSIRYSFLPDSYRVNVAAAVAGVPENSYLLVDLPTGFRSSESDTTEDHSHLAYAYKPELSGAEGIAFGSVDPGEREIEAGPISWGVAKNKYFIVGVLAPKGGTPFAEINVTGGPRINDEAVRGQATLVTPLKAGNAAFEVYVGPQEFKRLVALGREFETSNPYGGWIQGIVQPFATIVIRLLLWMKSTLGLSYGWILVIFGVAIRIILWPLNQKAMRSSMQMQRIQPELQAIQTRYKNEPQKLQQAMMELYKEHGMSPFSSLSGCLPMLIPLPVFFALFFVFQNTIEFRGVPFLWFPDISVKDPYYIIPVLVAATTMLMSWIGMRGTKSNEQQKMMMYLMPGIMLVFFFSMASGLNLYYFIQNLASLPQQWLIAQERSKPLVKG
ncbi:MAG: membrane protein insertase YidC [Gemmatimonas sp.]|uniref:membrane protein insertase YidC n=1 Tax=Gemmatimonas sp. TaxID=1962908 RepID=UPI0025C35F5F|nr:membrane protein insertase YidC [Gemmatimonas sp.]MCA2986454.1 membrane protein insertase YidC [Gemmatimonas sp.]